MNGEWLNGYVMFLLENLRRRNWI